MDEQDDTGAPEATARSKGSRQSLSHILSSPNGASHGAGATTQRIEAEKDAGGKRSLTTQRSMRELTEEEKNTQDDASTKGDGASQMIGHGRRNANGTVGSVYSGNKIRHLKKDDGIPLWRKDIQYLFLRAVFEDDTRCFTLEGDDSGQKHSFADIYIHAMAKSTKTSKVLREKLLSDRESAQNMAMICLLVNVGRMNTTLNCSYFHLSGGSRVLTSGQSFQKCAHSCAPTTRSPAFKYTKTLIRSTKAFRTRRA